MLKLKEHQRAAFFSPSENRCLPAFNFLNLRNENLLSTPVRQCIWSAKRTWVMLKWSSPTIVITANGEVQTHEEAIVYVKELDIFLTMKVLENTPAVLSLGKLCDENGYSYEWINGQKPHLIKLQYGELRPFVIPGLSSSSSGSSLALRFFMKQESHSPPSSSSSSSSPTVSEIQIREREDGLSVTLLQCQCLIWLMGQGNLMKPKPIKSQKQIKRKPR